MDRDTLAISRRVRAAVKRFIPQLAREWYWEWQYNRALPPRARLAEVADRNLAIFTDPGAVESVDAALGWLSRAQDRSRSADGGVARHFSLVSGWGESYPETTGYIIPTMLDYGRGLHRDDLIQRGRRMLDWCVAIQLPSGAFQAGTISANPVVPTTFNTGQILLGLAAGAKHFADAKYLQAMHNAAAWLRDSQDGDGCWRRFPTPFAAPGEKTYETHVAWGLLEAARIDGNRGYGEAGLKQVRWALTKQNDSGWLKDCCLDDRSRPLTHTIGYALRGILEAYRFSGESVFLTAARRTADPLLRCLEPSGRLAGRFHSNWRPAVRWSCLTGSVQIAHCWLMLFEATKDTRYLEAAKKANKFVRSLVKTTGDADIVGGVQGSFPVGGAYGRYEYLNWAAKFFIDSNRYEVELCDRSG